MLGNSIYHFYLCQDRANLYMSSSFTKGLGELHFISGHFVFEYENNAGQRFLVFPFVAKSAVDKCGIFRSYSRRRQLIKSIERIGKKTLLAYPDGDYPMLYTLVKENECEVSIGLWNLFPDKIKNAKIRINIVFEDIEFINCSGHKCGDSVVLDGYLYPYEFAGVKIKRM